ncbi:RNA polymerase, sigma-24 subunit, ECF subfamily [Paenibacillus curdlanolyticus YK9]|uniref:RNA polymerase, sigma-24 subunit, ECF subfamily n=1 Tax=Paenibacillus curdlanolyticus YK9 TaxID=717606 RepID=E0I9P4_9BACL|nr:RNA polymerase sigma factor [Paenibacillus curdlanolyticus]EFM11128.1 RNA polymerase, sigma-24 subunit, ECF subfamily [Paenibacillus curdlanolyticus YK9]
MQQGNEGFNELYMRYNRFVYVTAYAIVKDRFLAQDVVQEVFLNLYLHQDSIRGAANKQAWIRASTRNKAIDFWRKKMKSGTLLTGQIEHMYESTAGGAEVSDVVTDALEMVARLEPGLQQPLLRYAFDQSYQQIACAQHTTIGAVKARIHRARKKLREMARESGCRT